MGFANFGVPGNSGVDNVSGIGNHVAALEAKRAKADASGYLNEMPITVEEIGNILKCINANDFGPSEEAYGKSLLADGIDSKVTQGQYRMADFMRSSIKALFNTESLLQGNAPKTRGELHAKIDQFALRFLSDSRFGNERLEKMNPELDEKTITVITEQLNAYATSLREKIMGSLPQHVCEISGYRIP